MTVFCILGNQGRGMQITYIKSWTTHFKKEKKKLQTQMANKKTEENYCHPKRVRKTSSSTFVIEKHIQETKEIAIDVKFNLKPMIKSIQANKQIITKTILNIHKEYISDLRKTVKGQKDEKRRRKTPERRKKAKHNFSDLKFRPEKKYEAKQTEDNQKQFSILTQKETTGERTGTKSL